MENHKNLFKVSSGKLRQQPHIEINREHHRVVRSKRREDLFQKNRITTINQSPSKTQTQLKVNNLQPTIASIDQENTLSSKNETSTDNKMSKRHANYLQRFLKWKAIDKHQNSLKKRNGCKHRQVFSQPTASSESQKEDTNCSLYVFNNMPESPLQRKNTAINNKYLDIHKPTAAPFSFQLQYETNPLTIASATSSTSKIKSFANLTMKPSIASAAIAKSSHSAKEVKPFVCRGKLQELKVKPQSVQTKLLAGEQLSLPTLTGNHVAKSLQAPADPIKEESKIQINRQSTKSATRSVKSSNVKNVTKPFEAPASKVHCRGGRTVQMKSLPQRKCVNPLSSELSTRMKARNPNCKQNQIRQLSTKLELQEICNLQIPSTPEFKVRKSYTSQNKSDKSVVNLLKPRGDASNKSAVACSQNRESNGSVCANKRQLLSLPSNILESQSRLDSALDETTLLGHKQSETPVAVRQIMDTVKYFRFQLDKEIERLHNLCEEWHLYSSQNEKRLLETGAKDIIDAAIGQTKLLTSKKFMQFKGLIDRCESGATGKDLRPNDGSEASKPVFVDDLEGWWDMLSLQSRNVDKRFDNLQRLKANNWIDPDMETLSKTKPKVRPIAKRKPAAKPSSDLKSFLRKAFADNRKKQTAELITEESNQLSQTPKRCSQYRHILVRDRKSFSPVPTVLRVSNGSVKRGSTGLNSLLKSAIIGATGQLVREQLTPTKNQPISILKTPGTKKRQSTANRNVIFSAKKKVRRFQFTFEEGNVSGDEVDLGSDKLDDCEEDMSLERVSLQDGPSVSSVTAKAGDNYTITPRTYSLRNRVIKLRPSSEFM